MNVIPVPLHHHHQQQHCLHLKSFMTLLLLLPQGSIFDFVLHGIQVVERGYHVIRLPAIKACNVVHIQNNKNHQQHIVIPF